MVHRPTSANGVKSGRTFSLRALLARFTAGSVVLLASYMATAVAVDLLGSVAPALGQSSWAQGKGKGKAKGQAKKAENQAKNLAKKLEQQAGKTPFVTSPGSANGQGVSKSNRGQSANSRKSKTPTGSEVDDPPATVVEFFKRLVDPKSSAKSRTARSGRGDANIALPSPDSTFKRDEVLASNLKQSYLDLARRLGFTVENAGHFSTLDATITRLTAPPGLGARAARDLLRRELPGGQVSLNRYYRIYRVARGNTQAPQDQQLRRQLPSQTRCVNDQCYGSSLIRWHPTLSACVRSAKIGVIDTPIDHKHPAISGKDVHIGTFVSGRREKSADWHGTGVLALLAGDSKTTTPGLIPRASFYVADVFSQDASGSPLAESLSLLKAFEWMDAFGVRIINLSLAGPNDPLIEQAIARLSKKGTIFVAAAGNDGPTAPPNYPAAYEPVIAVTAVNKKLRNYRHANRGNHIDLAAPGVGIWTAAPGEKEGYLSGTSFAVPFVTAVAATHYRQLNKPSRKSLLRVVATKDLGPKGRDPIYGRGLVLAPASCDAPRPGPRRNASASLAERTR